MLKLYKKAPGQIIGNFYVYMAILEALFGPEGCNFDELDMLQCFALKGSANKYFYLNKGGHVNNFCTL